MDTCEKCGGTIEGTGGGHAVGQQPLAETGTCDRCGAFYVRFAKDKSWEPAAIADSD